MDLAEPTELPGGFASQNSCACTTDQSEEGMGGSHPPMGKRNGNTSVSNPSSRGKKGEYKKKTPKTPLQQFKSKVEWNARAAKEVIKVLRLIRNIQLLSDSTFKSWVLKATRVKRLTPPEHPHRLRFYVTAVHKGFSRLQWDFSSILFIPPGILNK